MCIRDRYLIEDGTCISSTDIDIQMLAGGQKKETTTTVSGENKTVTEVTYDVMGCLLYTSYAKAEF